MADTASQFDISQLSILEQHKLLDRVVRRMEVVREQRYRGFPVAKAAHPVQSAPTAPPAKACPLYPVGGGTYPCGLKGKYASFLSGTANMATGDVAHFNHNQSNGADMDVNTMGNMADNVGGTIAVTDPWSGSSCPPQRHEFPFWQGRLLPMNLEPPSPRIAIDCSKGCSSSIWNDITT